MSGIQDLMKDVSVAELRSLGAPTAQAVLPAVEWTSCPGFCGRTVLNATTVLLSECGACEWGMRVRHNMFCQPCDDSLSDYDWLYLLFVFLLPLLLYVFQVHAYYPSSNNRWSEWLEAASCVVECSLAGLGSVMVFSPRGSFHLKSCGSSSLKNWYPWMYNPVIEYAKTMPCTYEMVYPLHTLPFVYLLFCLVNTAILRGILYASVLRKQRRPRALYAALFSLPCLAVANAFFAGLFYFSFPFVTAMYSVGMQGVQLSLARPRSLVSLLVKFRGRSGGGNGRQIVFLLMHSLLLAFSIIALAVRAGRMSVGLSFLAAVPVPPLFFIATMHFSHPAATHLAS